MPQKNSSQMCCAHKRFEQKEENLPMQSPKFPFGCPLGVICGK